MTLDLFFLDTTSFSCRIATFSVLHQKMTIDVAKEGKSDKQRYLKKKEKKGKSMLKPLWLAGHSVTLLFGVVYTSYYIRRASHTSWICTIAYYLCLFGVCASYGVGVNTQFNLKSLPSYSVLLGTESVQFAILSVIWMFNRSSFFKIYPYMVVSLLQLSDEFKVDAILKLAPILSTSVLYNELLLIVVLFVETLLMRGASGFALVLYCLFYWLRILQFEHSRYFLYTQIIKLDGLMSKIKNENVQERWQAVKRFLTTRQASFEYKFLWVTFYFFYISIVISFQINQ